MWLGADTSDPIITFLNLGVTGAIVVAAISGLLWFKPAVTKMVEDHAESLKLMREDKLKAEAQRDEAIETLQTQIIPLLTNFTQTIQTLMPLLQDLVQQRARRDDERQRNE